MVRRESCYDCRVLRLRLQQLLQCWSDVASVLSLKRVSRAVATLHADRQQCKRFAVLSGAVKWPV